MNRLLRQVEAVGMWGAFHKDWLVQMRAALRPQLPPEYFLFIESETVLITPDESTALRTVLPDLGVATTPRSRTPDRDLQLPLRGSSALVEADETLETDKQYSLVIRRHHEKNVVAAMELLSPSNKGLGNRLDRARHNGKRERYLNAGVNLLEIDALLYGDRDIPAAVQQIAAYPRCAWTVFHSSGARHYRGFGWAETDALPQIDWTIDLQQRPLVDLEATCLAAAEFNRWPQVVDR